jgi:hypothetical protein
VIGRFASQFLGYAQHDSQELLAFLLDGLHEDLNRVRERPYMPDLQLEGLSDHEAADRAWEYHHRRNDSIIVDLFQGQFRSQVTCPDCQKVRWCDARDAICCRAHAWPRVPSRACMHACVCVDGAQVSVTFDPYMYLSLPIPGKAKFRAIVRFTPLNPEAAPRQVVLGSVRD